MALLQIGGLAIASVAVMVGLAMSSFSWRIIILTAITLTAQAIIFITVRHIQLIALKRRLIWPAAPLSSRPSATRHDDYHLFVLGSGGHTKEMLMMMDDGTRDFGRRFHRRYLVSSGDNMSAHALRAYETSLTALCAAAGTDPGTHDIVRVARARRVHQSLLTTPLSALRSVLDIVPALLTRPRGSQRRYPSLVFSNGPATGFSVALAIHVLKMLYVVPEESMRFVYVESWARISTLSLTGKLFHHTGLADFFAVQHAQVAAKYGIQDVGQVVFNARRDHI